MSSLLSSDMSAIFSYLIEHTYKWVIKLCIVLIVLNILALFLDPYLSNMKIVGMWWLNQTYYTMVTPQTANLVEQLVVMIVTFNLFMWIVGHENSPHSKDSSPKK